LRAGLFSQPDVIREVNQRFVSTAITVDEAKKLASSGNPMAQTLIANWEESVVMVFLTPDGKFMSKLDSYKDFDDHCLEQRSVGDVANRLREFERGPIGRSHEDTFLDHIAALHINR
jgi:hypothetical protein